MIVVDSLRTYRNRGRLSGQWCHMMSDTGDQEELHAFAQRLGLKRAWYQEDPRRPQWNHYDLRPSKRARAVQLGAREITFREMGEILLKLRPSTARSPDAR